MVQANLKILEDLGRFLHDVTTHGVNRAFFTVRPQDFTRERRLPMQSVIALLLNFCKRSLGVEIAEFFALFAPETVPPTHGAFCQQRSKLKAAFFQVWNHLLCESFYTHYAGAVKRWRGFLVVACDGSTLYLPEGKELKEHFGTQDNRYTEVPMARALQVYDVRNGLTLWAGLAGIRTSESTLLLENLGHLPLGSVVLLDRYFPSFALMHLLTQQGRGLHFVMRCKVGYCREVKAFVASGKSSKTVVLKATSQALETLHRLGYEIPKEASLQVRLVKVVLATGEVEVLLTDLLSEALYGVEDFKAL